jgi:hypothetical protein
VETGIRIVSAYSRTKSLHREICLERYNRTIERLDLFDEVELICKNIEHKI